VLLIGAATVVSAYALYWIGILLMVMYAFGGPLAYKRLEIIRDDRTGLFVEMGQHSGIGVLGILLHVFDDDAVRTETSSSWPPAIVEIANVRWDRGVDLSYENGCYVVRASYGWGGLETPSWRDPRTGEEFCFRLDPNLKPLAKPSR
jgi:hypothetical protein